jgi:tight adherence protein C
MLVVVRSADADARLAAGVELIRLAVAAGVLVWIGMTLIFSSWSRLSRPSLTERLRPYNPGGAAAWSEQSGPYATIPGFGEVLVPLVRDLGDRLARGMGVAERAERRLERIHSATPAGVFRARQIGAAVGAAIGAAVLAALIGVPALVAAFMVIGAPALVFLVIEQRLAGRSEEWQRSTARELPVIAEQLAMLLNAGFSVGAALPRLAGRSRGCVARDLERVVNRVQQGLSEGAALEEWSDLAGVEGVRRLVSVLTLHSEAADLGRLVSSEARSARRELHRRTLEQIERRAQQVWVPVTVATLIPGAILLAVPFLAALHEFANA